MEELKKFIEERGFNKSQLAQQLNMTRESFYNKLNGATDFKLSEVKSLSELLRLTKEERDKLFKMGDDSNVD